jgi:hypothetical protein
VINVALELRVVSDVAGRVGNWRLRRMAWLRAVPRRDDWVELDTDGEVLERVAEVRWRLDGTQPLVVLSELVTSEADTLDSYDALTDDGWDRLGGPWKQGGP